MTLIYLQEMATIFPKRNFALGLASGIAAALITFLLWKDVPTRYFAVRSVPLPPAVSMYVADSVLGGSQSEDRDLFEPDDVYTVAGFGLSAAAAERQAHADLYRLFDVSKVRGNDAIASAAWLSTATAIAPSYSQSMPLWQIVLLIFIPAFSAPLLIGAACDKAPD